jgi:hypothetical protein
VPRCSGSTSATLSGSDTVELHIVDTPVFSSPTHHSVPRSDPSRENQIPNMWKPSVLVAAALALPTQALHFYLDGAIQKCFYEELPKDTLVVGTTELGCIS